jgi:hypothetical protein
MFGWGELRVFNLPGRDYCRASVYGGGDLRCNGGCVGRGSLLKDHCGQLRA